MRLVNCAQHVACAIVRMVLVKMLSTATGASVVQIAAVALMLRPNR